MVSGRDGPYHRPYLGDAQSKCIDVIPTPWAIIPALGLGADQVCGSLYIIDDTASKCKIFAFERDRNNNAYY
jgi:hypothetical protein